jgi:hypothetical protein
MPELILVKALVDHVRVCLRALHRGEEGYSTETAIVIAIVGAAAIVLAGAIVAAIARRTSAIDGF